MGPPDRGGPDDCCTPAGRFEEDLVTLIVLVQALTAFMAVLTFLFWVSLVLGSLYHPWMLRHGGILEYLDVDWYPGVLGLALLMAVPVILLNFLYE